MERDRLILPLVVILVVVVLLLVAFSLAGNRTFQMGTLNFQYPNTWSQNNVMGNFSSPSLYSQVTFTSNFADQNGQQQTAYIVIQMQQKAQGVINVPPSSSIVTNTTNSSVASLSLGNLKATQLGSYGQNIAAKATIIDQNNYYYVIEYICPPYAINQTEQAYNTILTTLKIS